MGFPADVEDLVRYSSHALAMRTVLTILKALGDATSLQQYVGAQIMARAILADPEYKEYLP
jgi:hypothetical protein